MRRTLAILLTFGVMSNVLMLNFCYDVPRKIYSTHLVLMALFLLLPDVRRLIDFFIRNRRTEPSPAIPLLKDEQLDRKSTRLNSSHLGISYAVFCLKKQKI